MTASDFNLSLAGTLKDLGGIRRQVREFLGRHRQPAELIDEVELAVDEAVTNVIKHAYPAGREARVEISGHLEQGKLKIAVRDYGRKYTPKPVTAADVRRILAGHQTHGLGRYLMKQSMDSVRYKSVPRKYNETVMMKKIK